MASENGRNNLIMTAQRLFFEKGFDATTLNDIAVASGVSEEVVQRDFASMQDVLIAVCNAMGAHNLALIRPTVTHPTLNATDKFNLLFSKVLQADSENMDQTWAAIAALYHPNNMRLRHELELMYSKVTVPQYLAIIEQGVAEGQFTVEDVENSAEFIHVILRSIQIAFVKLLLNTDRPENAHEDIIKKFRTGEKTIERILAAKPNSLHIVDVDIISRWFK